MGLRLFLVSICWSFQNLIERRIRTLASDYSTWAQPIVISAPLNVLLQLMNSGIFLLKLKVELSHLLLDIFHEC